MAMMGPNVHNGLDAGASGAAANKKCIFFPPFFD
jgi:hypothetical protein